MQFKSYFPSRYFFFKKISIPSWSKKDSTSKRWYDGSGTPRISNQLWFLLKWVPTNTLLASSSNSAAQKEKDSAWLIIFADYQQIWHDPIRVTKRESWMNSIHDVCDIKMTRMSICRLQITETWPFRKKMIILILMCLCDEKFQSYIFFYLSHLFLALFIMILSFSIILFFVHPNN